MIITQLANTTAYAGQSVLLLREAGGLEAGGEEMLLRRGLEPAGEQIVRRRPEWSR